MSTFKVIQNLVEKENLDSTTHDQIVDCVKSHYDPKPSVIMQRYKFNTRTMADGESVATYVAALRDIAQHCEFKDTLQDMLRDRLVCGVKHAAITNKLLTVKTLTYNIALETAQAMESAEKGARQLQTTATEF